MLVLLSLFAADPVIAIKPTDLKMSAVPAPPAEAAPRSRYRLDPDASVVTDGKAAALRTTGAQCSITGARLCTKKPRTIFTSSY